MHRTERNRLRTLLLRCGGVLAAGGLYAAFAMLTGWLLPCPFRLVTGWKCPGCGVSHMCLRLLQLDVPGAWRENAVLLCLLPVMALIAVRVSIRYVRAGSRRLTRWENGTVCAMIGILLVFGVVRNLIDL